MNTLGFDVLCILSMICYTFGDSYSDDHQIRQITKGCRITDREKFSYHSKRWHRGQAFRQAVFYGAFILVNWSTVLLGAAIHWLFHDVYINVVTFGRHSFYVGSSSEIDLFFKNRFKNPEHAIAVCKALLFIVGFGVWVAKRVYYG